MKTIREVAEAAGVSKQAIRDKIKQVGLQGKLQKQGNAFVIDSEQEALIVKAFQLPPQSEALQSKRKEDEKLQAALLAELCEKNEQIRELNARLAEVTAALVAAQDATRQAQGLHAATVQLKLDDGSKKPWYRRWFGGGDK